MPSCQVKQRLRRFCDASTASPIFFAIHGLHLIMIPARHSICLAFSESALSSKKELLMFNTYLGLEKLTPSPLTSAEPPAGAVDHLDELYIFLEENARAAAAAELASRGIDYELI